MYSARVFQDVLDGLGLYLFSAYGRIGTAYTRKQQAQEIVDLGGGSYGGTGVPDVDFLFNGYGRRDAFDGFHVGFGHTAQELAGIG